MSDAARVKEESRKREVVLQISAAETMVESLAYLDAFDTDQTAALREENARLRGAADELLKILEVPEGQEGDTQEWDRYFEAAKAKLRALLADPEGQRAGEEWRALHELENAVTLYRTLLHSDGSKAGQWDDALAVVWDKLAAVERARQP